MKIGINLPENFLMPNPIDAWEQNTCMPFSTGAHHVARKININIIMCYFGQSMRFIHKHNLPGG